MLVEVQVQLASSFAEGGYQALSSSNVLPGLSAGAYPDAVACEALWEVYCETGDAGTALQLASDSLRAHIPIRYV